MNFTRCPHKMSAASYSCLQYDCKNILDLNEKDALRWSKLKINMTVEHSIWTMIKLDEFQPRHYSFKWTLNERHDTH